MCVLAEFRSTVLGVYIPHLLTVHSFFRKFPAFRRDYTDSQKHTVQCLRRYYIVVLSNLWDCPFLLFISVIPVFAVH